MSPRLVYARTPLDIVPRGLPQNRECREETPVAASRRTTRRVSSNGSSRVVEWLVACRQTDRRESPDGPNARRSRRRCWPTSIDEPHSPPVLNASRASRVSDSPGQAASGRCRPPLLRGALFPRFAGRASCPGGGIHAAGAAARCAAVPASMPRRPTPPASVPSCALDPTRRAGGIHAAVKRGILPRGGSGGLRPCGRSRGHLHH